MFPNYDIEKIKFAVDDQTFQKAVELYEDNKVKNFIDDFIGFGAIVEGGQNYRVYVRANNFSRGMCSCYLGQNGTLCKHMVALAIYAVLRGGKISLEDKESVGEVSCSGDLGELDKEELNLIKKDISSAMRYLKPYLGPSKTWDANQHSLEEGCKRLTSIINKLPISRQTTELIIKTLLRIDKKLSCTGIDDSNGIVGGFIEQAVFVLEEFARIDPNCIKIFKLLTNQHICFDWERSLIKIYDEFDG